MHYLIYLIQNHPYLTGAIVATLFSSLVTALPSPVATDSKGYVIFFNFMHALALAVFRIPQVRSFVGLQENPTTAIGIAAKADAQALDPNVQGTTQKQPEKP